MAKTVSDLAQALSETERKELLDRIQRSLSLNDRSENSIVRSGTANEQRNHQIQEGIGRLGLVQRLLLWLRRILTNRTAEDLFVEFKLESIAKTLEQHHIADVATKSINIDFPETIYQLYLVVIPVKRFLNVVWSDEEALRSAVQFVLEQRIPKAKSQLFDFIPALEMQSLFETAESKATLRQELTNRVNAYIDEIPGEIFSELEQGLMPLYHLRQLCFFDFIALFNLFSNDAGALERGTPIFKPVLASKVSDQVEDLFFAMHSARKAATLDVLPPQLFKYVQMQRYKQDVPAPVSSKTGPDFFDVSELPEPDAPPQVKIAGEADLTTQVIDEGLKQLRKEMKLMQDNLASCMERSCISDLIRYYRNDPYYRFLAYVPTINLKDFYLATLRMKLLEGLDAQYIEIRRMVVDNLRTQLFPNGAMEMEFFKRYPCGTPKNNLPGFRCIPSIFLLYSFLHIQFMGNLRDVFRGIIRMLPTRNRDNGSEILFHTTGLEGILDRLAALDHRFSGDSDEGKSFMRMKTSIDKDLTQERQYRAFVAQYDKDNRDLLEEGIEHLRALADATEALLAIPAPLLGERFAVLAGGANADFTGFLRGIVVRLRAGHRLIRYQRALDDELGE